MDFDSLAAVGSWPARAEVIVMDDSRDMVWALNNINEFYAHERLRPMHSLPRRFALDEQNDGSSAAGWWDAKEIRDVLTSVADNIAGRNNLLFWRGLRLAYSELRRQVS